MTEQPDRLAQPDEPQPPVQPQRPVQPQQPDEPQPPAQPGPLDARASIVVPTHPGLAFARFTAIAEWWRRGTRHWNHPRHGIRLDLEPGTGGRLVEVYGRSGCFEIGRVAEWLPGERLVTGWREETWPEDAVTRLDVGFESRDEAGAEHTRVAVRQTGWESVPEGAARSRDYAAAWAELLGDYAAFAARTDYHPGSGD
ncbi:MAG: hypothetical protein QM635_05735 [Microbacteriaceae bacterium]